MQKIKACFILGLTLVFALALAQTAHAVATSCNVNIGKNKGGIANPINTGDLVTLTLQVSNATTSDDLSTALPAILLQGAVITEFDACADPACSIELPTFQFISCTPRPGVPVTCAVNPGNPNSVIINVLSDIPLAAQGQAGDKVILVDIVKETISLPCTGEPLLPFIWQKASSLLTDVKGYDLAGNFSFGQASGTNNIYFECQREITVTKTCQSAGAYGDPITIAGQVCNSGNSDFDLTNILLDDGNDCGATVNLNYVAPAVLLPGECFSYTGTETCAQLINGGICNDQVTLTGTWSDGQIVQIGDFVQPYPPTAQCSCPPPEKKLTITKACQNAGDYGDPITIAGTVCNTADSDIAVNNIVLSDGNNCGATVNFDSYPSSLAPGECFNYTGTETCAQLPNGGLCQDQVTLTGTWANGDAVQATDIMQPYPPTAECECPPPDKEILVTKTCQDASAYGENITIAGEVCNSSNSDLTLTNIVLADGNNCGATVNFGPYPTSLAPGECFNYTGTESCAQLPDGGLCQDQVTLTGTWSNGDVVQSGDFMQPYPPTAECECVSPPLPCVSVVKTCTDSQECETPINYDLTIQRCDTVPSTLDVTCTVTDTATVDGNPATIPWSPVLESTITLSPGAVLPYTAIYSVPDNLTTAIIVTNTVTVVCTDELGRPIVEQNISDNTATCSIQPCEEGRCWLTGGGVKFEPLTGMRMATAKSKGNGGPMISIGGNVNPGCSPTAGDGGNWNHIDHDAKLHIQIRHIEVVKCGNIPESIRPPGSDSPKTPFNFIEWMGTGTIKGISGNKVSYDTVYFFARAEDRNEPGSKETLGPAFIDRYWIGAYSDAAMTQEIYRFGNEITLPPGADPLPPTTICGDDSFACTDTVAITGGNLQLHDNPCDKYN